MTVGDLPTNNNKISSNDDDDDDRRLKNYQLIKVIGKGCVGKVMLSRDLISGRLVAIKSISKAWVAAQGSQEIEHTRTEQRILAQLSSLNHPFLIKLHSSFQTRDNLVLVLDYVGGGDLASQLAKYRRFCVSRSRFYCAEIAEGLRELHRWGIIYRDCKPENVLLQSSGHIKLTDFGLSKWDSRAKTFCGTAEYLAPEILMEQTYSFAVDWWSLGTFLYEMLTGITPFWAEDQLTMYKRVLEDRLEFPPEIPLSPDARDLISGLLDRHPQNRLCSDQIRQHPFFHSIDWDQLLSLQLRPPYLPYVRGDTDVSHFDEEFTQMTPRFSPAIRQQQQQLNCNGNHGNVGVVAVSSDDDSCGDGRCGCALHHHNDKHYEQQQEEDAFAGYSYLSSSAEAMMSANCASMPINNFTIDNNSKAIIVSEEPKAFVKRWAIKRRRGGSFGSIDGGDKAVSWQASPSIVPESWKIMRSSDINNSNNVNDGNGVTVSCGYVGGPSWRCRTTTIEEEPEYGGRSDDDELGFSMDL